MTPGETLTEYRRRLRVLVEDLSLCGVTKTLEEILDTWKKGLSPLFKELLLMIERAFPDPGTAIEVVYRLEKYVLHQGGGLEIDNIAFIVSSQTRRPPLPDFRHWADIGCDMIYAHDVRNDHIGIREGNPYHDVDMMRYITRCRIPQEVLLARPPVIPELRIERQYHSSLYEDQSARSTPFIPREGAFKRYVAPLSMDNATERAKRRRDNSTKTTWQESGVTGINDYGIWRGTPQGGWITEEDELLAQKEKQVSNTQGIRMSTLDLKLAPPGQTPQERDTTDSDSDSANEYPELGLRDKGKGYMYPIP